MTAALPIQAGADADLCRAANAAHMHQRPSPLPPELELVDPLPMQAMPDAFRPWIADVSERMQCPPDFVAVPLLIGASSLVARKVAICPQANTDWTEKANLWGMMVGRPGTLKSPAMMAALSPLQRLESKAAETHRQAVDAHSSLELAHKLRAELNEKTARERLKQSASADVAALLGERAPEAPTRPRYLVNDLTYEKLGEILAQNPQGVLSVRDELRGLLSTLAREDNASARALYLQTWSGGSYVFDRIARGTITIPDARLSMIGCIQPGPISSFIRGSAQGGAMDDGLLQRFLICWPDQPSAWRNVDRLPDTGASRRVFEVFHTLDGLSLHDLQAEQPRGFDGEPEGLPFLRFAPDALEVFEDWRNGLEQRLRAETTTAALEAALSKFRKHVPALALTLHTVDGKIGPVDRQSTLRALALADYFESHAKRAYGSGLRPSVAAAKAVLRKLRGGSLESSFTLRDVYRPGWEGLTDPDLVASALGLLVSHCYLTETQVSTGGRPTFVYEVVPEAMQ